MNQEVTGNYPAVNLPQQQQPGDNSYSNHLEHNQWHQDTDQSRNQYTASPAATQPFYTIQGDCAYPPQQQQQYSSAWNNWSTEQNNNAPVYNPSTTSSALNPQADPWQWMPSEPHSYPDNNHQQQQEGGGGGWGYVDPQTTYPMWQQGNESANWHQQQQGDQQAPPAGHWEQPLTQESGGSVPALGLAYDTGPAPPHPGGTDMDQLTGQLAQCTLEANHTEIVNPSQQGSSLEESNQEVPPSFQQVESLHESLVSAPPVADLNERRLSSDPPLILPRKGSLFQPPVPTSAHHHHLASNLLQSTPPPLVPNLLQPTPPPLAPNLLQPTPPPLAPNLLQPTPPPLAPNLLQPTPPPLPKHESSVQDMVVQQDVVSVVPGYEAPAYPEVESQVLVVKNEELTDPIPAVKNEKLSPLPGNRNQGFSPVPPVTPPIHQENLVKNPEPEFPENMEKPQPEGGSSGGARPHPLHLVLHRQHFSNDVDETCRTTLWENPIDSIPNVTLMPLAKQSKMEREDNREATQAAHSSPSREVKRFNRVLGPPLETQPVAVPTPEPPSLGPLPVPNDVPTQETVPTPSTTFPTNSSRSSVTSSAHPTPEKHKPSSPYPLQQNSSHRASPVTSDNNRWTDERPPEKLRNNQNDRLDRDYDHRSPHRKNSYPDQAVDNRYFRPGYYPPQSGNYPSRPSSRSSEPTGDNYYSYERERTNSRMSEVIDDRAYDSRRTRDLDYSRSRYENRRDSDHRPRGYDDNRDIDHRLRNYDDPRDADHRSRHYDEPRDADHRPRNYDEPRGTYEDSRRRDGGKDYFDRNTRDGHEQRRGDYLDSGNDHDYQRGYYTDRHYSRSRREDDYYSRHMPHKGYDYSGWPDPYAMFYAQYYNNYRANVYGTRNNYGYHKELYETDPKYRQQVDSSYQAYYNAHQAHLGYDSDQHSLHSGRSSVNDELRKERLDLSHEYTDSSLGDSINQPTPPPRMTPVKFSCSHPVGHLHPGRIVTVLPGHSTSYVSSVNIYDVQHAFHYDPCLKDVKDFPGPLISGQTHKKDVMAFCHQKVQELQTTRDHVVDRNSQILLWELLILLVRQNGNVIGSDIAELLLKDMHSSSVAQTPTSTHTAGTSPLDLLGDELRDGPSSGSSSNNNNNNNPADASPSSTPSPDEGIVVSQDRTLLNKELSMHQVTHKFTEYLLYGNKKDALEWAVRHNLWGHALFLAYRMGSHSHANLMTRFANSLPLNDPLQTLYQLMSGRQPVSVTSVADEKWGDWRPHLAMILSNPTVNPQVDLRSIVTLGDTLAQKGCLSAAHFCYLMAQVEFGTYENKASKIVLLGADHMLPFEKFATNEAIHLTEIYEYAMSLANPNYLQPNFQPYKFLYATRLTDYGLVKEALHYCEIMSTVLLRFTNYISVSLFSQLDTLGTQLKYHDPHYTQGTGELEELGDPLWLTQLHQTMQLLKGTVGEVAATPVASRSHGSFSEEHQQGQPEQFSGYDYQQQPQQQQQQMSPQQGMAGEDSGVTNTSGLLEPVPMMNVGSDAWNNQYSPYVNNHAYSPGSVETLQDPEQLSHPHSPENQSSESQGEQSNLSPSYFDQVTSMTPMYSSQECGQVTSPISSPDLRSTGRDAITPSPSHSRVSTSRDATDSDPNSSTQSTPTHRHSDDYNDHSALVVKSPSRSYFRSHFRDKSKKQTCPDVKSSPGRFQGFTLRSRKHCARKNEPVTDSSAEASPSHSNVAVFKPNRGSPLTVLGMLTSKKIFNKKGAPWKRASRRRHLSCPVPNNQVVSLPNIPDQVETKTCLKKNSQAPPQVQLVSLLARKPLVFGGTFPIDEPCLIQSDTPKDDSESCRVTGTVKDFARSFTPNRRCKKDHLTRMLMSTQKTFPVDLPCCSEPNLCPEHAACNSKTNKVEATNLHLEVIKRQHILKTMRHQMSLDEMVVAGSTRQSAKKVSFKCIEVVSDSEVVNKTSLRKNSRELFGSPLQGSQSLYGSHSRQRQDSVASNSSRKGSNSSIMATQHSSLGALTREEEGNSSLPSTQQNAQLSGKAGQQNKQDPKKADAPKTQAGRSWFGNIFNKFLPKGPNQMILPDDKTPRIVWDEKKQMWVDLDGNNDDVANANIPPPKDSELFATMPSMGGGYSPASSPPTTDQNRFQRPKHRGMRQNYVDILNSNNNNRGSQGGPAVPPDTLFPKMEPTTTTTTSMPPFFVPPAMPVSTDLQTSDTPDFLTVDRSRVSQDNEPASHPSPLLNPTDYSMTSNQNLEAMRKPPGGRLSGRRAYPS